MKAAAVLMEILRAAGVRYLFGNPGTTELPLLDALPDSRLGYVGVLRGAGAEAPSALRRALKVALAPPTGPVFLSLPMDLMGEVVEDAGEGPSELASRALPEAGAVGRAAQLLAAGKAPLVIAGDGVARSGGVAE